MASETVDGMDVLAVRETVGRAVALARRESMPTLIEARCYRFMGHSMSDPVHGHYRTREEVDGQKLKDPVRTYFEHLAAEGLIDAAGYRQLDADVRKIVDAAVAFAEASPEPPDSALYEDVYSQPYGPYTRSEG
jgi:pyruvate dehydrogenase E1 component alpha subunit